MVTLKHLRKEYPGATPLEDVNVTINKGDVIAIIGPSGTGKSTLIRCINQLDTPTSGEVIFDGKDITIPSNYTKETRMKIGMVFQSYNLFGHKTVLENVMFAPIQNQKLGKQEAYDKAMKYLHSVGLAEKCFRYPDQLSGGQQQRVAIARTLAMEPELILLDEPTSALDPTTVGEVEAVIKDMADQGHTMMIVTHSMQLARNVANRIFYMDQGGIYEDGTPEQIFEHPKGERTKKFINDSRTLKIFIESRDYDLYEGFEEIRNFVATQGLSRTVEKGLQIALEEGCIQCLIPMIKENPMILFIAEHLSDGNVIVHARYNGNFEQNDVSDNLVAAKLLFSAANLTAYGFLTDPIYTNYMDFMINQEGGKKNEN